MYRKRPERIGKGLKCIFKVQFFKASSEKKKVRPITFIVWVLGRVEKMPKKRVKNEIFVLNKY